MSGGALERIRDNPFYVLGVLPDASAMVVEREGQKLLGMIALGLSSAATYPTPVGPGIRTAQKIRDALAELRRPERRLVHELWASLDPSVGADESPIDDGERADAPWPDALEAIGWGRA